MLFFIHINITSLIGELVCCKESVGYIKLEKGMEEEENGFECETIWKDWVEGGDRERKMA